jgi:hypothetical protein
MKNIRIAAVPAEMRNENHLNTSLEGHLSTILLMSLW